MSSNNNGDLTPSYQCITPLNNTHFLFPLDTNIVISSVDRIKNLQYYPRARRSFTPMRNSFLLRSPDLSPIQINNGVFMGNGANLNFVRLPPEKISKAAADSTSSISLTFTKETKTETKINNLVQPQTGIILTSATPNRPHIRKTKLNEFHGIRQIPPYRSTHKHLPKLNVAFSEALDTSMANGQKWNLNNRLNLSTVLSTYGFQQYIPIFLKKGIDFATFLNIDDNGLIRIGVENIADRQGILSIVDDFNNM